MRFSQLICLIIFLSTVATAQTAKVCGKITLKQEPLEGVTVTLESPINTPALTPDRIPFITHSDTDGRYCFNGVPAGRHAVTAGVIANILVGNKDYFRSAVQIAVSDGDSLDGIDLEFRPGGVISGKITSAGGQPYIGMSPYLFRKEANGKLTLFRPMFNEISRTDDRGVYRFFGLTPGTYIIKAVPPKVGTGQEENTAPLATYYPGTTSIDDAKPIELKEGEERTDIDFEVKEDTSETYDVEGRFVDAFSGTPLGNISFGLVFLQKNPITPPRTIDRVGTSTASGDFIIRDVSSGRYRIFFSQGKDVRFYAEPKEIEVIDKALQGVEVKAQPALSITGKVVVEGGPEARQLYLQSRSTVMASLTNAKGNSYQYTWANPDAEGNFQFGGLEPGKWTIGPSSNPRLQLRRMEIDGVPFAKTIDLEPGKSISGMKIIFGLGTGKINGTVTVVNGIWPSDIAIGVIAEMVRGSSDPDQYSPVRTWCDSKMNFAIDGLLPGQYKIQLAFNGSLPPGVASVRPIISPEIVTVDQGEVRVSVTYDLSGGTRK